VTRHVVPPRECIGAVYSNDVEHGPSHGNAE